LQLKPLFRPGLNSSAFRPPVFRPGLNGRVYLTGGKKWKKRPNGKELDILSEKVYSFSDKKRSNK